MIQFGLLEIGEPSRGAMLLKQPVQKYNYAFPCRRGVRLIAESLLLCSTKEMHEMNVTDLVAILARSNPCPAERTALAPLKSQESVDSPTSLACYIK